MKLHVDMDASACPLGHEARRYRQALDDIVTNGISEPDLRQLLNDCKTFLKDQSRNMVMRFMLHNDFSLIPLLYSSQS